MTERARLAARSRGFTLIEAILVIVLIGALAAIAGLFIVQPFSAARDMTRRTELTDAAETALDRMTREIRLAVPNSVRVDAAGTALEFLRSKTGGRYRRLHDDNASTAEDPLDATLESDTFDVLGGLAGSVAPRSTGGRTCADGNGDCLVINNTGTSGFDAYQQDNVAAITDSPSGKLKFNTDGEGEPAAFPAHSARQRFQVIDTVVSYICDGSKIVRYQDYGLKSSIASPGGDGTNNLLARDVVACDFDYSSGASNRHGLVTIDLTIRRKGETVRLIDQAHVVNVP